MPNQCKVCNSKNITNLNNKKNSIYINICCHDCKGHEYISENNHPITLFTKEAWEYMFEKEKSWSKYTEADWQEVKNINNKSIDIH